MASRAAVIFNIIVHLSKRCMTFCSTFIFSPSTQEIPYGYLFALFLQWTLLKSEESAEDMIELGTWL